MYIFLTFDVSHASDTIVLIEQVSLQQWLGRLVVAVFLVGVPFVVDVLIQTIEAGHFFALNIVPPVAHEQLLIEHGAVGTEKRIATTALLADVIHL